MKKSYLKLKKYRFTEKHARMILKDIHIEMQRLIKMIEKNNRQLDSVHALFEKG